MVENYGIEVPEQLPAEHSFAYGEHERHVVDFWRAKDEAGAAPLLFFVHGGAWRTGDKSLDTGYWKQIWFPQRGFALASANYRLVPDATVEQQAEDTANALAAVLGKARDLGIDTQSVLLAGHSAGAHLVTLLGTDESWLRAAGLSFANITGVIGIDGACYDVAMQIANVMPDWSGAFIDAFGEEPGRQRRLSPNCHATAPNAPAFLLLHMPERPDSGIVQANALADALRASGSSARVTRVEAQGATAHHELNQLLGKPGHGTTEAVSTWLDELFTDRGEPQ
ncbi:MAG: alpha/beta hydrolase [Novosphingobium sp.]|nr:alpha/beta hydrolase [Novosphingobium sp.]